MATATPVPVNARPESHLMPQSIDSAKRNRHSITFLSQFVCASKVNRLILTGVPAAPGGGKIEGRPSGGSGCGGQGIVGGG